MCVQVTAPASGKDEYFVDDQVLKSFIDDMLEIKSAGFSPEETIARMRPRMAQLMADQNWLPAEYQQTNEGSGMGSGIGMWLLYRAGDGSMAFSSLVVPPGASTPVHDHLAWGLVGLYKGTQDEVVYTRVDDGGDKTTANLSILERRSLVPGGMYELLPATDIHEVTTTSDLTSVSLHLLSNDNGCIWRHRFTPDLDLVEPFKSGWLNVDCTETAKGS